MMENLMRCVTMTGSRTAAIWSDRCMIIFEFLIVDLDIRLAILSQNQHSNHKNTIRNRITSHLAAENWRAD